MKKPKFIRLRFFIILLFLFPFVSIGQMSGIYTLGSSGNDSFFSFSHAVNNLKKGVSGPVTIYVSAGVYFDQVLIPAIPEHPIPIL
jgi:pectin methylesterase-like acyl-CoA thioesterase